MPTASHYKAVPVISSLMGTDGTSQNQLHVDSNGIAKTQVVNAVNVIPHSTLNGLGSPTASLNVSVNNSVVTNLGSQGNLANGENFSSGNTSSSVDVSAINQGNLLYSDTSGGGTIAVEVSGNGSAYYKAEDMAIDLTDRQAVLSIDLRGITHIRLKAGTGYTNVVASLYGTA